MYENDTIAALATGKGNAAIAIIRMSGKEAFATFHRCIKQKERFQNARENTIHVYTFFDSENHIDIDEITAIKYKAPKSYTGEDMVEIMCHGGEIIIDTIFKFLAHINIRYARRGEFTKRAYLNGKLDLLKAEAIGQLIEGNSERQILVAREQFCGNSKKKLQDWKNKVMNILVNIEAHIEFPEEDDITETEVVHYTELTKLSEILLEELKKSEVLKKSNSGLILPIIGIANAGKSSLFNLIMESDRVIVHHEEGTTRDAISEEIILFGEKVRIIDTAGLNTTNNPIEQKGIKKTIEILENCDIILLITPSDKTITDHEKEIIDKNKNLIAIISKSDLRESIEKKELFKNQNIPFISASFLSNRNKNEILQFLGKEIKKSFNFNNEDIGVINTKRHQEIAIRLYNKTMEILKNKNSFGLEVIAQQLKGILADFDEFLGATTDEHILNAIFSEFCIGK